LSDFAGVDAVSGFPVREAEAMRKRAGRHGRRVGLIRLGGSARTDSAVATIGSKILSILYSGNRAASSILSILSNCLRLMARTLRIGLLIVELTYFD
jgi:hypothetical protein